MKPNKLHIELCELVGKLARYWRNTNDIDSPTHYSDNAEEVNKLALDYDINEEDAELLTDCLDELYHTIKNVALLNNKS